ncbi:MAG: flagellar protein [Lachnoclostridium sp.]|nr:flagellar protein [Lachnospira sp.]MCM1246825.1 flagellar protein [Lachnoclostridium sp.]MCM1535388.1 flagellar protein [Clostridium sp.]
MDIQTNSFLSIEQLADRLPKTPKSENKRTAEGFSFNEVLMQKTGGADTLKLSKHAAVRLSDRGIKLTGEQWERLEGGARKAEQKGIKDSLVIVDELAFIVNVPNQTIITAMDSTQTDENVFTNINGAVIA